MSRSSPRRQVRRTVVHGHGGRRTVVNRRVVNRTVVNRTVVNRRVVNGGYYGGSYGGYYGSYGPRRFVVDPFWRPWRLGGVAWSFALPGLTVSTWPAYGYASYGYGYTPAYGYGGYYGPTYGYGRGYATSSYSYGGYAPSYGAGGYAPTYGYGGPSVTVGAPAVSAGVSFGASPWAPWLAPVVGAAPPVVDVSVVPPFGLCQVYAPVDGSLVDAPMDCGDAVAGAPSDTWVVFQPPGQAVHGLVMDPGVPGAPVADLVFDPTTGQLVQQVPI